MLISLSKPGVFYDPETKLRLEYGEVKDVLRVGSLTRQVLNGGGIIIVSPSVTPKPTVEPVELPTAVTMEEPTMELIIESVEPDIVEKPKTATTKKHPSKRGRSKKVSK